MKELAQTIRELRVRHHLSQRDVGEQIGVSDRAVSKWELGLSQPSVSNLVGLSKLFGIPFEQLLSTESDVVTPTAATPNGMESITELYKIGRGPSSSHTIGPERACTVFRRRYPEADRFRAVLFGSLAKTGKGHGTDVVIRKTFSPMACAVEFDILTIDLPHPNTMRLIAYRGDTVLGDTRVFSVGGGSIMWEDDTDVRPRTVYPLHCFSDIAAYCRTHSLRLWEYAMQYENAEFPAYIHTVWQAMKASVKQGLEDEGQLPGGLGVWKKARSLYRSEHVDETAETRENRVVCAYAFAVGEQNASCEHIVTAPTCGAAGVLPAVLCYQQEKHKYDDKQIERALMTAGLIGNLIKTNASISGAECGCQAEIGSACAMASAALAELFGLSLDKIEYAAEIAIEHHLGLTCDPICGLVQIPCIERNAVAAMRAINAVNLASFLWDTRKISFDRVVQTMKETGRDMHVAYKETAEGGLARLTF